MVDRIGAGIDPDYGPVYAGRVSLRCCTHEQELNLDVADGRAVECRCISGLRFDFGIWPGAVDE
jgi:hypothetical protein